MERISLRPGVDSALALAVVIILAAGWVMAGDFSASISPSSQEATQSVVQIGFDMNDTDSVENITLVNITIPGGFTLQEGSNSSSVVGSLLNFSNSSSSYMTWSNETVQGFVLNGTSEWFNASFTLPTTPGNYTFNVTAMHTDGQLSYSEKNVTVVDTTAPSDLIPITGEAPQNDSWISTASFYLNFSFTELNPDTCQYDNSSSNQTGGVVGDNCSVLVTGYAEGSWDYLLWMNDTSGNLGWNGTYNLSYDSAAPNLNALGLYFQGANVSAGNVTERGDVNVSVNISDALSGVNASAVWAEVVHETQGLTARIDLAQANGDLFNGTWDSSGFNNGSGVYAVYVNGTDEAGNTPSTGILTTLEFIGAPDLIVYDVNWTSDNANPGRATSSDNLTLEITISNIGDGNFTGNFNVTVDVQAAEQNRTMLDNSSMDQGESVTFNVTINSSDFPSNGLYIFLIEADPASENGVNESSESNNTYSLGVTLGYNISLAVLNGTAPPSVGMAHPDQNITIIYYVNYSNGEGVSSIGQAAFEFYNEWGATYNVSDRIDSFSDVGGGVYSVSFDAMPLYDESDGNKTRARYGDNYFNVSTSSGSYSGKGMFLYNVTAPDLAVQIDDTNIDEIDLAGASYKDVDFNVTITNQGNDWIYDLEVEDMDSATANWKVSYDDFDIDHSDIDNLNLAPGTNHIFTATLRVEETHSSEYNLYFHVWGNDTENNRYQGFDREKVEVTDSGDGGDDNGDDGGTGGGGGDTFEHKLSITDWEDEIDGYPGESNTTRITVKNTGDLVSLVKVEFTCDPVESNPTIGPVSKSLGLGKDQEFIIDFDIKEDAGIGEYDCTARAYVTTSESSDDEETVVLRILPTEEGQQQINEEYENLTATIEELLNRFGLVNPSLVNDTNLTKVENLLNNVNSTLKQIKEAIEDQDYITAYELIEDLETSIDHAELALSDLELEQTFGGGIALSGTWFWFVIIIVVVIAVAFVAYLLFPQKSFGPKKGLLDSIKGGASKVGSIKEGPLLGKKQKIKPMSRGGGGPVTKIKGAFSKIKEKLKRKKRPQKEVTQYFSSSSSNLINFS
jgi:hypothetical protein